MLEAVIISMITKKHLKNGTLMMEYIKNVTKGWPDNNLLAVWRLAEGSLRSCNVISKNGTFIQ